jgi:hypothetical protein
MFYLRELHFRSTVACVCDLLVTQTYILSFVGLRLIMLINDHFIAALADQYCHNGLFFLTLPFDVFKLFRQFVAKLWVSVTLYGSI